MAVGMALAERSSIDIPVFHIDIFSTVVLIYRTWAIFGRRRTLGIALGVSWVMAAAAVLLITIISLETEVECTFLISPFYARP